MVYFLKAGLIRKQIFASRCMQVEILHRSLRRFTGEHHVYQGGQGAYFGLIHHTIHSGYSGKHPGDEVGQLQLTPWVGHAEFHDRVDLFHRQLLQTNYGWLHLIIPASGCGWQ